MMKNESDERLVERFQTGERAAFDEIARRYQPRLLRFLRLRTRSLETAEDLTQETLIKAFASLDGLKKRVFLAGWLRQIAYRTFLDSTRRRRWNVASFDENAASNEPNEQTSNGFLTNRTTPRRPSGREFDVASPEARILRDDEGENLWRVAQKVLTSKEFKALWLRYVEEASDAEAAVALGVTPVAVRVALTRARQKLIARLRPSTKKDGEKRKTTSVNALNNEVKLEKFR